jgi:molybdopterin-guanine dinucleotide biosynthesis protein A
MGRDKAILSLCGETLAARAARRLLGAGTQVALADGGRGLLPGLRSVADGAGRGPAAGILGAAREWPGKSLLILACDLPEVPAALLAALAAMAARVPAAGWIVPRWRRGIEPLCALYRPPALAALAAAVARGVVAPHRLAEAPDLAIDYLEGESLSCFGSPADLFLNLNTPEDLARWQVLANGQDELSTAGG